jgi:hypothetical protein
MLKPESRLSNQLYATMDVLPVAGLERLADNLLTAWIEQALDAMGTASIRRWQRQ